ncbi:MAG: TonB-dependent receptor [Saprospiraceae bacterium]
MRPLIYVCLFVVFYINLTGQTSDTTTFTLDEVLVTAYRHKPLQRTPLNTVSLKMDSLSQQGNFNVTDAIAKTPGVTMLSTGVAISKPVIRGLFGNRVLCLLSGLKFDNQQWQEEHGLGLSDIGLSKVEIIKGPLSVLYGSEATGGVINLIGETGPLPGQRRGDVAFKLNSNTLGGMLQGGYQVHNGKQWFGIRAAIENNADYSDGNNQRVLNSRFDGYYVNAAFGFTKKNWISTNRLSSSFNRFGFIFNDAYEFIEPDNRWSRSLSTNPDHLVLLNILSSENKFIQKDESILHLDLGIQSNERMENEGGGAISLNMHLLTFQYLLKWEKEVNQKTKVILSNLGSIEKNNNYGSRKIVPDAWLQESNLSANVEYDITDKLVFENGVGIGEKWIKTLATPMVNDEGKEAGPFSKFSPYFNVLSGMSYFPSRPFNIKFNVATGVRIPNLAELSSDGLHEGIFTYEIGDKDLKNEQNLCFNFHTAYTGEFLEVWASAFYNYFTHYVYLAPMPEEWFGFPIYRYKQQDARQYGAEAGITIKPVKALAIGAAWSGMNSKTADGNYTPFTPPHKITPKISYHIAAEKLPKLAVWTEFDFNFKQNHVAPDEIATPAYHLWNAGISANFNLGKNKTEISLTGNNLLNEAYYDHLSRFKYFGLLNIGRNITLQTKIKF